MPEYYYAIGATLASMTNIEDTYGATFIANSREQNRIPLLAPVKRRLMSDASVRNGKVNRPLAFSFLSQSNFRSFVYGVWGSWTTSSIQRYVTAIDERGYYSAFLVTLDRPYDSDDYSMVNSMWNRDILIPCFNWVLQSTTLTASDTITTGDRMTYCDTSGGTISVTLPSAVSTIANTVYSFEKTSASNNMIIDADGADTIDGAATANFTAIGARLDIVSDGSGAWTSVSA